MSEAWAQAVSTLGAAVIGVIGTLLVQRARAKGTRREASDAEASAALERASDLRVSSVQWLDALWRSVADLKEGRPYDVESFDNEVRGLEMQVRLDAASLLKFGLLIPSGNPFPPITEGSGRDTSVFIERAHETSRHVRAAVLAHRPGHPASTADALLDELDEVSAARGKLNDEVLGVLKQRFGLKIDHV